MSDEPAHLARGGSVSADTRIEFGPREQVIYPDRTIRCERTLRVVRGPGHDHPTASRTG